MLTGPAERSPPVVVAGGVAGPRWGEGASRRSGGVGLGLGLRHGGALAAHVRPVSDREFRYQGLPFPANTWKRFERHLKDRVSELVRETALVLGRPAVLLTSQKAIDILEEGGKLKPGLELYIRSDRFV